LSAALLTVLDLLGPQLGRLTLATVIDLDASVEHDRAKDQARVELRRRAVEGGHDLLAVGSRGAGLSKVLLGSTAATLAARSKIPVLLSGGLPTD
jgi:nucleotide-binding universal stress UspA family protein